MKGLSNGAAAALCCAAALGGGGGCYAYRDIVDPCYPERYNYMARKEVHAALTPQVQNGHVLDQTVWNYHFEPGTDRLTSGGLDHLSYLARRRPHPDPIIFLQTAQDIGYDKDNPAALTEGREKLNASRRVAIEKFLIAQCPERGVAFQVLVHDPAEVGLPATPVNVSVQQWYLTRMRGGLPGGGGAGVSGGGGASGGGGR